MTSSFVTRVVVVAPVVLAALSSVGCHLVLGQPIPCEVADEATCPADMHCAAGTCVEGAPRCGDGDVTGAEACDDGNAIDSDACSNTCRAAPASCGNARVEGDEACDDGNTVQDDSCANDCTLNCGNGTREGAEACDDGNLVDDDECSNACTINTAPSSCGDTIVDAGEECDDGNLVDDDGCTNDCVSTHTSCGDGSLDPDEACDDGNAFDGDGCSSTCVEETGAVCGNGVREDGEACDDGNNIDTDICSTACVLSSLCGNGEVDIGEPCDPQFNDCNFDCTVSVCGDGQNGTDEQCDEGAQETATCTAECTVPAFNDGRIDPGLGEVCDDGNTNPNDACHNGAFVNVSSCADIQRVAPIASGAYAIDVDGDGPLPPVTVHCDMSFNGGGWTRVLLTDTARAIAELPEGDTSGPGRLSTAHVAALARRSQQLHIRTLNNADRSVTSVPGALPIERLRLGGSISPVQRGYPQAQVSGDWTGPFATHLNSTNAPIHTAWPDVYEAPGNTALGLQLFDDGTQLVSRWGGIVNEAIEVWVRPVEVCGDGVVQDTERCDDGNAIDADGCSHCTEDTCVAGTPSAAILPVVGVRTMVHAADVDADGFTDVVVVELVSNTPTVSVARGTTFGLQRAVPVVLATMPDTLSDPVIGGVGGSEVIDVDGDGALDVVLFDQFNCTFQVFRGTGTGAFVAPPITSPAPQAVGTAVCGDGDVSASGQRTHLGAFFDVNRDGLLDAVLPVSDGTLRVVEQQASGQFTTSSDVRLDVGNNRCTPQQVIAADLLGNGQQSLVVTCAMVTDSEQQFVTVLEQTASGFTRHALPVDARLKNIIAADVNSDGVDDLIGTGTKVGGQRATRLLRNDGDFAFTISASLNALGDRVAADELGTTLGLGVVGGSAFLRVAIASDASSLTPSSSSGPVVSDYAQPAFVDADGRAGSEYIAVADGRVFIERLDGTCTVVTP